MAESHSTPEQPLPGLLVCPMLLSVIKRPFGAGWKGMDSFHFGIVMCVDTQISHAYCCSSYTIE